MAMVSYITPQNVAQQWAASITQFAHFASIGFSYASTGLDRGGNSNGALSTLQTCEH